MVQLSENMHGVLLVTERRRIERRPELKDVKFMICDDCKHNCLTYEPSNEGTCLCDCHSSNN